MGSTNSASAFPGYYGTPFTYSAKTGLGTNTQNILGSNGGAVLGVALATLQNQRLFDTDYGYPYLGVHTQYNENKALLIPSSPINGVAKPLSAGKFNIMTQDAYIMIGFTTKVAGLANTLLNSPGLTANYSNGENRSNPFRNTWLKRVTGGWYYQTGQPVNAQFSRDNFKTDAATTRALPGRLTFTITGKPIGTTNTNYQARND